MKAVHALSAPRTPLKTILVRHGATSWSERGQHTGRTDLPLVPEGETAAEALGSKLSQLLTLSGARVVLSSPLERARETCRLAGFGDEAVVVDDLLEWDYGEYEGLTTDEIHERRPSWDLFRDGCPGGESLDDVAARARRVVGSLLRDPSLEGGVALLFAHGHVLRVLAATWAKLDPDAARALPLETGKLGLLGWSHSDPTIEAWNL